MLSEGLSCPIPHRELAGSTQEAPRATRSGKLRSHGPSAVGYTEDGRRHLAPEQADVPCTGSLRHVLVGAQCQTLLASSYSCYWLQQA